MNILCNHITSVVLLILLLCIFWACGPFRTLMLRKRVEVEAVRVRGSNVRVVFIHGTFDRKAKWTDASHAFIDHVEAALGPCDVYRLLWSGDNYQHARRKAAQALSHWARLGQSAAPLYFLGHSHGGGIAAMAAMELDDIPVRVVTLSTPFIIVQPRIASLIPENDLAKQPKDDALLLFGIFLWIGIGAVASVSFEKAILFGLVIIPLMWMVGTFLGIQPIVERCLATNVIRLQSYRDEICDTALIRPRPDTLLILRTPADEATGILAAAHIVAWIFTFPLRLLGSAASSIVRLENRAVKMKNKITKLGVFGSLIAFAPFVLAPVLYSVVSKWNIPYAKEIGFTCWITIWVLILVFLLFSLRCFYLLVAPALTLLSTAINFLMALPFGVDLAARSALVAVSAEPAPLGQWQIRNSAAANAALVHSTLYDGVLIEYALAKFVEDMALKGHKASL